MLNRAKCKLCNAVIESFHATDYVECACKEIMVYGGDSLHCAAKNWENFLRIDDEGNHIQVKVAPSQLKIDNKIPDNTPKEKPTKKELVGMLSEMIKNIEKLPEHVLSGPISHYDYLSLLMLLSALFEADCKLDN